MEKKDILEHIQKLYSKDSKTAYASLLELVSESEKGNNVYSFFDEFAEMMENENSYIRTRGIILIAENARWDTENKVDEIIDSYLKHILDVKPITARQCIKYLQNIIDAKKDLMPDIEKALMKADTVGYKDSMKPLIDKDISDILKNIRNK